MRVGFGKQGSGWFFDDFRFAVETPGLPVHLSGNEFFAGSFGRGNNGDPASPGDGIRAEGDPGAARVDHALDQDGGDGGFRQSLLAAIGADGFGFGGGADLGDFSEYLGGRDFQIAIELAGEGMARAVFRLAGGADGEGAGAEGVDTVVKVGGGEGGVRRDREPRRHVEAHRAEAGEGGSFSAEEVGFGCVWG